MPTDPGSTDERLERIRQKLIELLVNFEQELNAGQLRSKVLALVPVQDHLDKLGAGLIPRSIAASAQQRILHYFQSYPYTVIAGAELRVVAGISEWARRVRELRKEQGWKIYSGLTVAEMIEQESAFHEDSPYAGIRRDDYVLLDTEQDREAAHRWHTANRIRRLRLAVRDKILLFLQENVAHPVSGEELRYVANNKTEWARRTRELRTELGWPVVTRNTGRPELSVGMYVLEENRQSPEHDRHIPDQVRGTVLRRDGYTCRRCGWNHKLYNRSDPRHLELHHIHEHVHGGPNEEENLITLCTVCHDDWHAGRHGVKDFGDWLSRDRG